MDRDISLWERVEAIKNLLLLLPDRPGGESTLSTLLQRLRDQFDEEAGLPVADPASSRPPQTAAGSFSSDEIRGAAENSALPVALDSPASGISFLFPCQMINQVVTALRYEIINLLDAVQVSIDSRVIGRLRTQLNSDAPLLGEDFRGTDFSLKKTGKSDRRNELLLEGLAQFLKAIKENPAAVLGRIKVLSSFKSIASNLLSVDDTAQTIIFRGHSYPASHEARFFLTELIEAADKWVSIPEMKKSAKKKGVTLSSSFRADRSRKDLPKELKNAIETSRSKGAFLHRSKLS